MSQIRQLLVGAALVMAAFGANAALITVQIDGIIDSIDATHNLLPFENPQPGQDFSLRFMIESTTVDADLPDPTHGNYLGAIPTMTVIMSGQSFTIPVLGPRVLVDGYLSVRNDSPVATDVRDSLTYFRSGCTTNSGPCFAANANMSSLASSPPSILATDGMVTTPTIFASFATQQLNFRVTDFSIGAVDQVFGRITGVSEVPAPGSLPLLLSALGAIGARSLRTTACSAARESGH